MSDLCLYQYFLDLRKVNTNLVDLENLPEIIYQNDFTCNTELLLFKPAIVDHSNLLTPVQSSQLDFHLFTHTQYPAKSIPVVLDHIGIHLAVVVELYTGNGFSIENG